MKKNHFFILIILVSYFYACTPKRTEVTEQAFTVSLGRIIPDSVAPPIITKITAANAPKVIRALKPTIVQLHYPAGVGVPYFTNFNIADGLPQNYVLATTVDHEGNIWFATLAGVSKYNGTSFTNYTTGNGLISDFTNGLFVDSKKNIWISSFFGISIYNGKYFINPSIDTAFNNGSGEARNFTEDSNGAIWFGSTNGLYQYKNDQYKKFTTADGLADSTINNIIKDKDGNLLISTNKGVSVFNGQSFTPYTKIAMKEGKSPYLVYCDKNGNIWFDDRAGGLGKFDGTSTKIFTAADGYTNGRILNQLTEDKQGNIWIANGTVGLTKFDGNNFLEYSTKSGLPSGNIMALTADELGNIWVGTPNGAAKISYSYLSNLELPADESSNYIVIDEAGHKWTSGSGNGIGKYNSDQIAYYGKELLNHNSAITKPFIDHAGNIWFGIWDNHLKAGELIKFDGVYYTIYSKQQGIPTGSIENIFEDNLNNIWICGYGGVTKLDGNACTNFESAQGLSVKGFHSSFQDSKHNYWFGSGDSGVYKFDGQSFTLYNKRDGLPHNFVNDITEDPLGNIWLATDGGAAKFDGHKFTTYRAAEGLGNIVADVEPDSINHIMWFNTILGLSSLQFDQLEDKNPVFQHYNQRTGFHFGFSIPRSLVVDKQGVVWGGGSWSNGIFRFDYKASKNFKQLPISINNILLDNKNIFWQSLKSTGKQLTEKDSLSRMNEMTLKFGKPLSNEDLATMSASFSKVKFDSVTAHDFLPAGLVIPYQNNNISFEFAVISPSFGKSTRYQYKLDGYSKDWSNLSNKTEAVFGNVKEGEYTFHLRGFSSFGNMSEASYTFKVMPPWWRAWWAYSAYALVLILGIYLFVLWRINALKKEKILLEQLVSIRTAELNQSLTHLKATQSQLIQSEKMASLGQLTAGIAHEIENPLNFVNNFSEVSNELMDEMNIELDKGDIEEAKAIGADIKQNLEKINHHGKRADLIVKGMLQHSIAGSGAKEPSNINGICTDYIRLALHGIKAKDKSFDAKLITDFDESIEKINIVPQEIGRVLINLLNNAFYAVNEKKNCSLTPKGGTKTIDGLLHSYEPTITVTTRRLSSPLGGLSGELSEAVQITVTDNGIGIPENIVDKIFQPFFTTKPTGQGTGLGLSLSYDIVHAHGGELKVESKEDDGTKFIIQLPVV